NKIAADDLRRLLREKHHQGPNLLLLGQELVDLGAILERCLAPEPAERPSAAELARLLTQQPRGRRRSKWHLVTAAVMTGLLAAGLASILAVLHHEPESQPTPREQEELGSGLWFSKARDALQAEDYARVVELTTRGLREDDQSPQAHEAKFVRG